jgi:hypothetical protein
LSIHPSIHPSVHPSIHPIHPSERRQACETSSKKLKFWQLQNDEILRDFLDFLHWQRQKRSNSARHPSKMESCV